jgi:hypothetical protein
MPDGESHGEHGEAEGQSDASETDAEGGIGGGQDSGTTSTKDEPRGADEFGDETFAEVHRYLLRI